MAENDEHQIRRHSTRKGKFENFLFIISIVCFWKIFLVRAQTASLLQPRKSLSSPSSPINQGNPSDNPSRSRHLWNLAVESVLDREKTTPTSISTTSSTVGNEPIGWYNLTKR